MYCHVPWGYIKWEILESIQNAGVVVHVKLFFFNYVNKVSKGLCLNITFSLRCLLAGTIKPGPGAFLSKSIWNAVSWDHSIQFSEDRHAGNSSGAGNYKLWCECCWFHASFSDTCCSSWHQMHYTHTYTFGACCKYTSWVS